MTIIAETVEELGTPSKNGTLGIIRVGGGFDLHEEFLTFVVDPGVWVSQPRVSMQMCDTWGMVTSGSTIDWKYPHGSEGLGGIDNAFGFQIQPISFAKGLSDAGFKLQEHLSIAAKSLGEGPTPSEVALNWYEQSVGDGFLTPIPSNQGVRLPIVFDKFRYHFTSTGWQNTRANLTTSKASWYPELYVYGDNIRFRHFTAYHRWVGGTLGAIGGTGGVDGSKLMPPHSDYLLTWHCADFIPKVGGSQIDDWPDFGGYNYALRQSVPSKQPILIKNISNGHAIVRMDGVNDFMQSYLNFNTVSSPITIFLVLKPYAGGTSPQIWSANGSNAPPLIYRSDNTDELTYWANGTDIRYHRSTPWSNNSPFICFSLTIDGANSSFWENKVEKASGNAGSSGFAGLTIGANYDGASPAHIDVAEVLVYFKVVDVGGVPTVVALTNTERNDIIDWLNVRHALF